MPRASVTERATQRGGWTAAAVPPTENRSGSGGAVLPIGCVPDAAAAGPPPTTVHSFFSTVLISFSVSACSIPAILSARSSPPLLTSPHLDCEYITRTYVYLPLTFSLTLILTRYIVLSLSLSHARLTYRVVWKKNKKISDYLYTRVGRKRHFLYTFFFRSDKFSHRIGKTRAFRKINARNVYSRRLFKYDILNGPTTCLAIVRYSRMFSSLAAFLFIAHEFLRRYNTVVLNTGFNNTIFDTAYIYI